MKNKLFPEIYQKEGLNVESSEKNGDSLTLSMRCNDSSDTHKVELRLPIIDFSRLWWPGGQSSGLPVEWWAPISNNINHGIPLFALLGERGECYATFAVSELERIVETLVIVHEETSELAITYKFPQSKVGDSFFVKINCGIFNFSDAIRTSRDWLYEQSEFPAPVYKENNWAPLYSTWYSFHQFVSDVKIEKQAEYFSDYGLKSIIVDDGWQTEDNSRGYGFVGEWAPAKSKFPELSDHVERIQKLGVKYYLWVSSAHIGKFAKEWEEFGDKSLYINEDTHAGLIDPRYPEFRAYLAEKFAGIVRDNHLDGLKIDFIDSIFDEGQPEKSGMDAVFVGEGVKKLVSEITQASKKINPNLLVEFRQGYFGPIMQHYCDLIRVGDCPNNFVANRLGVLSLRLVTKNIAIHSDMIEFNLEESVEMCALQLLNVLFGAIQVSVDLDKINTEQQAMLHFWLSYQQEHANLLFDDNIMVSHPELGYTQAYVTDDTETIFVSYLADQIIKLPSETQGKNIDIINATTSSKMYFDLDSSIGDAINCEILDCKGTVTRAFVVNLEQLRMIDVPRAGILRLKF